MQLADFIRNLPAQLAPIRSAAERLAGSDSKILENGAEFSHRPVIGPVAYALTLFRPLSAATIKRYEDARGLSISPHYAPLLSSLNGAHAFRLSLYGIPGSMANDKPLLDRSASQPHDLATANRFWRHEYKVPPGWFHFGSAPLSHDENAGYFFDELGNVHAARKSNPVVSSWSTFSAFLSDELARCEAMYPDFEAFMAEAVRANPKSWLTRLFSRRARRLNS